MTCWRYSVSCLGLRPSCVCVAVAQSIIVGMGPLSAAQDTCDLHPITGHVLHCCKELVQFRNVYTRVQMIAAV